MNTHEETLFDKNSSMRFNNGYENTKALGETPDGLINQKYNFEEKYTEKNIPLIDLIETYQGEGPNCGKKMVLARFKYCNKACSFCDTQKMMKDLNETKYSLQDIQIMLKKSPNLMITGGEPTLHKLPHNIFGQLENTIRMMKYLNYGFLDIETNGYNIRELLTQANDIVYKNPKKNINISWSPKFIIQNDFNENISNLNWILNSSFNGGHKYVTPIIKIVIGDDLDKYKEFIYKAVLKYGYDSNKVYLMPKGTSLEEINKSMELVLKVAEDLSCNISSRLHILHNFK